MLTPVAGDVWRGSLGDLVDVSGRQAGRMITLADLVAACERIDAEEATGRPALRLVGP